MLDWLIRSAQVLDGTGADAFPADVGIKDGTIAAVGRLTDVDAAHVLDAQGRTLTPGFLDIHRHTDAALFRPNFGRAELAQGLTTLVGGNCGMSLAPLAGAHAPAVRSYLAPITGAFGDELCFASLADYFAAAERTPQIVNNAMLAGMGTLRALVAGFDDAPLTDGQYRELHRLVERSLADGAVGVSLGLGYAPECFYSTEGLIRALEPLRGGRLPVTVHMRQEGDGVVDALREMLTVARELRCPVEISHLKGIGRANWGRAVPEMLRLLENARAEGLDVACDVYPYSAGSTQLIHVLPPEFQKGGLDALTAALRDPGSRAAMRGRMETGSDFENITHLVGFENVVPISLHTEEYKPFEGKSLAEIADMLGKDPYDALFDLLAAERCEAGMIDFIAAEEDIEAILRAPVLRAHFRRDLSRRGAVPPARVRQRGALSRALCPRARHPHAAAGCAQAHDAVRRPARSFPQGTHRRRRGRRPVPVLAGKYSGERCLHRSAAACLGHGRRVRRGRTGDHGRAVYRRDTGARAAGTLTNASFFRRKL